MKKEIKFGEEIPHFYGIAYVDYPRNRAICYPIIINLIALLIYDCNAFFKNPKGMRG